MEEDGLFPELSNGIDIYIMPIGEKAVEKAVSLALDLRIGFFSTEVCYEKKSMGALFKKAERKNAKYAVIIGDDELKDETVNVKNMNTKEQVNIPMNDLMDYLISEFDKEHQHSDSHCCCEGDDCECDGDCDCDCDCDNEEGHCCHHNDCNKA